MTRFVGICVVLFVVAIGFIVLTQSGDLAALFAAFRSAPTAEKVAWFIAVLAAVALVPTALWLSDSLSRQRKLNDALELRLGGVRQSVRDLTRSQTDVDAASQRLARTDPEIGVAALAHRLDEGERVTAVQETRNAPADLQSRVDALRARQDALRERLSPVLEKRRAIEQLFAELDSRGNDIDRTLSDITGAEDAAAIGVRLDGLMEFVRRSHGRCEDVEQAAKTLAELKDDFTGLRERLAPHVSAEDGIKRRLKDLDEQQTLLGGQIDDLHETPQGGLAARVQAFSDDRKKLVEGIASLETQFSRLAGLRKDSEDLSRNFDRVLDLIAAAPGADAGPRIAELSQFIQTMQVRFGEIERNMALLAQMQDKLGELQSRLVPLEAPAGGVADLVARVAEARNRLATKIATIEADESGDLASRVSAFLDARQELERRVASVTEHFSKLAAIRRDIAGLFVKLTDAANSSSN